MSKRTSENIDIVPINKIDRDEWNTFIISNNNATYFSSTDYLETFSDVYFIVVRNTDNKLIAGLPFIVKSFLPFIKNLLKICTIESAIIIENKIYDFESVDVKRIILNCLCKHLKKKGVIYCYISHWVRSNDSDLLKEFGFIKRQEGTVIVNLLKDEKEIVRKFKSGFKHALNKAKRLGVEFTIEEGINANHLVQDFSSLRLMTQEKAIRKNKNVSMMLKSEDYIRKILASKYNKTYIAAAYYKNRIAHIVLFVSMNDTIYAYLSGSNVELNKECGAANFLYYKTIIFAKSIKLKYLDMGGTPINPDIKHPAYGVYFFKRSFGGEQKVYDGGYLIVKKIRGRFIHLFMERRSLMRLFISLIKITNKH